MPDSYGKRQRNTQKAKKFAAREERRAARKRERADREAGVTSDTTSADGPEDAVDEVGDTAPDDSNSDVPGGPGGSVD